MEHPVRVSWLRRSFVAAGVMVLALVVAGCSFSLTITYDTEKAKVGKLLSDFGTAWETEDAARLRTTLGDQITVVTTLNQYEYYKREDYVSQALQEWTYHHYEQYEIQNWDVDFAQNYTAAAVAGQLWEKKDGGAVVVTPVRLSLVKNSGSWQIVRIDYYAGGGHPFAVPRQGQ
ncbi:MAG: hypothetical protein IMX01_06110 [Limnochordaceae bacterium]|nr:hypothetical protein [Limnochordaceae bacterium]